MKRALLIFWILLFVLFVNSCGTATPVSNVNATSTASLPKPPTGLTPTSILQPDAPYSQNIRFEHFSLEEGLSQSVVTSVLQDRTGYLWVGTEDGLNRYDGYNFKVYKPDTDNQNSLSDNWITSLAEDAQGYLWVGTRLGGLNRYDPTTDKFTRFQHDEANPSSISNNKVSSILPDQNSLWIGTEYGLDYYNPRTNTFEHHRLSNDLTSGPSSNSITAIFKDSDGILWVGTYNAGLNAYNISTGKFEVYKNAEGDASSLSHNRVLSIQEDQEGKLWVGTANGLNRFESAGKYFTRFINSKKDPDSISDNSIYVIYKDHAGSLWFGTKNGLDRYDSQLKKFIHHRHQPTVQNSLSNNTVYAIYEDFNGVLWIGTFGGGLNKYNRQQDKFAYYRNNPDDPNSLSADLVFPIYVHSNGMVWIGTQGGGLNRFDPQNGHFSQYRHNPEDPISISSDDVYAVTADHSGNLWVGTSAGLDYLDLKTGIFTSFQPDPNLDNSLSGVPVYAIFEDSHRNLWVGTSRGLDLFDTKSQTFNHYETDENDPLSLIGTFITSIIEDDQGNIWVGTFDDGLKRISPNLTNITQYKNNPKDITTLSNDSIISLFQDSRKNIWIGTTGGGINLYRPETNTFARFTEKDGLSNNVVYGILEDNQNYLWLSTNFGLSRFDTANKTFRNFTSSNGLQSNEFNQNAFAKDAKGNLYFGGIAGFNVFSPREIKDNPIPPPVVLTSITLDGKPLNPDITAESLREITLIWPQDSFEFEFAALAYGQSSKNQYSYKLENFDTDWNNTGYNRTGRYTNLPGGTYTLHLRGSNNDGTWNEIGTSIKVTIVPPFWETVWFQVFLTLAVFVVGVGGFRWRVKTVESRNRELERVVQKRTADLEKRTREIEALYQADEKILRNVTFNQVFQTLVDVSVSLLKADRSVVFVWDEERHKIIPRVSHGFRPETLAALTFDEGEGMVGEAMKTGEPYIVSDLKIRTLRGDIQTVIRAEGIQSFAHFPIIVDGKVTALFNVGYTRPNALNEDNIRLFTALVQRASLSIANMELFEQTKDLAVMEERNRLARDLHDSAKQKAFAALAQLGTANGLWKSKSDAVQPHLKEAETLVYEVIQELTFLIQEIYPIALQEKGLPTTLREYVYEWENRNDAEINLTVRDERVLPLDTEQAIYRVIQEALANISRHSRASRVDISLVYQPDSLQVHIADDGCGFDMNQKAKGLGFRSMRERISSVRGNLQIQSAPGQGTRLIVQLPIKQGAGVEKP
jgi:ligand-binding sensor domain-containing protein/signal transduction histidine kinase